MTLVAIIIAGFCALWFVQAALVFKNLGEIEDLANTDAPAPAAWPRVSVIMPARNEATDIAGSLDSRLSDGYPDLEIVVVDDRSDDDTPRIVAQFAGRDPRVTPVLVEELPAGWLGKVHALDVGVRRATGEWLLFSDADIEVAPGMLAKAVAHCEAREFDLLALVPEFRSRSRIVDVLWAIFMRIMAMAASPKAVRDPRSKVAVGSGGFTLVRRSVFDRTPGFEHLRLETGDDMALGAMVKQAGGRCEYMNGRGAASLSIYDDLGAFFRGVEKNGSTFAGTPFALLAVGFVLAGCVEYSPLVAIGTGVATGTWWLAGLGAVTTLLATAATVAGLASQRRARLARAALACGMGAHGRRRPAQRLPGARARRRDLARHVLPDRRAAGSAAIQTRLAHGRGTSSSVARSSSAVRVGSLR